MTKSRTPHHMLGGVQTSTSLLASAVLPAGSLLGGFLGAAVGPRAALAVTIAGMLLGSLWIVFSPERTLEVVEVVDDAAVAAAVPR